MSQYAKERDEAAEMYTKLVRSHGSVEKNLDVQAFKAGYDAHAKRMEGQLTAQVDLIHCGGCDERDARIKRCEDVLGRLKQSLVHAQERIRELDKLAMSGSYFTLGHIEESLVVLDEAGFGAEGK